MADSNTGEAPQTAENDYVLADADRLQAVREILRDYALGTRGAVSALLAIDGVVNFPADHLRGEACYPRVEACWDHGNLDERWCRDCLTYHAVSGPHVTSPEGR